MKEEENHPPEPENKTREWAEEGGGCLLNGCIDGLIGAAASAFLLVGVVGLLDG